MGRGEGGIQRLALLGRGWERGFSASCLATAVGLDSEAGISPPQATSFLCATERKQRARLRRCPAELAAFLPNSAKKPQEI